MIRTTPFRQTPSFHSGCPFALLIDHRQMLAPTRCAGCTFLMVQHSASGFR